MSFIKSLYEHLKTRKKYNTLELYYKIKSKEYDDKVFEMEQLKNQHKIMKDLWEQKLEEQEQIIIELKKKGVKKDVSKSNTSSSKVSRTK